VPAGEATRMRGARHPNRQEEANMGISREDWQAEQASSKVVDAMREALRTAWELGYRTGSAYMANLRAEPVAPPLPTNPWEEIKEEAI
jgi:hypothetical protein